MRCIHCGQLGHIRKFCRHLIKSGKEEEDGKKRTQKVGPVQIRSSHSKGSGFIASHALSALSPHEKYVWIVDSGATCHMCHNKKSFFQLSMN